MFASWDICGVRWGGERERERERNREGEREIERERCGFSWVLF